MPWTLDDSSTSVNRIFTRPLDGSELTFYYDLRLNGTGNLTHHFETRSYVASLFDETNVMRTWIALKQLFPLLGASLREDLDTEQVLFVVDESRLSTVRSEEIRFASMSSREAALAFRDSLNTGPGRISEDMLIHVYILSRIDDSRCFDVIFNFAHMIADVMSSMTLTRMFLDILTQPSTTTSNSTPDLIQRLHLVPGHRRLDPYTHFSVSRRRWRNAIARVIIRVRMRKYVGGSCLPAKVTTRTHFTSAKSRSILVEFTPAMTARIIATCRKHKITFGYAHGVVSQIASSRVLHRRYFRGEIEEDEWDWRRKEPFHVCGPIDCRPYFNKEWYRNGGASVIGLFISFFLYKLPSMPSVPYSYEQQQQQHNFEMDNGAPPFSSLFSRERFFIRCNMIKAQLRTILHNPLFFEIAQAFVTDGPALQGGANALSLWQQAQRGEITEPEVPVPMTMSDQFLIHYGGTTVGVIDPLSPAEYPLPASNPFSFQALCNNSTTTSRPGDKRPISSSPDGSDGLPVKARILSLYSILKCRPGELCLGASTRLNKLRLAVYWDENVYEGSLVEEWLSEIKAATEWYLGGDEEQGEAKL